MEKIIDYFKFMRGVIYKYDERYKIYYRNITCDNKALVNPDINPSDILYVEDIKWLSDNLLAGKSVNALNIMNLPEEASTLINISIDKQIGGFIAHPIFVNNKFYAFIVFEYNKKVDNFIYSDFFKIMSGLIENAIEKVQSEEELFLTANYDPSTGFMNRFHFESRVENFIEEIKNEPSYNMAILHIDIDYFSSISKIFGDRIASEVLKKVGTTVQMLLKDDWIPCIFSDDEFMVCIKNFKNKESLEETMQKILNTFKEPLTIDNLKLKVSLNIGACIYGTDGYSVHELIKNVSLALYNAKQLGKDRYYFCQEDEKLGAIENIRCQNKLFDAVNENHFLLAYQPQVNSITGKIVGAEALIRWNDPEEGIIPPFKFIPLLERNRLIIPLGKWIIDEALREVESLSGLVDEDFKISVNLSPIQFIDENLIDSIKSSLKNSTVKPQNIEFEITESIAGHGKMEQALDKFNVLRDLGVRIAIDDFGTEFSSLNRIQALPFDKIKIDKVFIDGIGIDKKKEAIIEIIINLASVLGVSCIAEGVEEKHQVDFLNENGCNLIQGFYYSKPLFEVEILNYLKKFSKK